MTTPLIDDGLNLIHPRSSNHRGVLLRSEFCGCFYCLNTFHPKDIKEWIDKNQTALCPVCGIDAVLPEIYADKSILSMMREEFFLAVVDMNGNRYKIY